MEPINVDDLRRRARRRLPKVVFDFIDGGAQDERTLEANCADFAALELLPRVLVDVSQRSLRTTVLGREIALPILLAPTGLSGVTLPKAEIHAAKAAEAAGTIYCLSTTATSSIEEIRAAVAHPFWFQLYVMRDRGLTRSFVERAAAASCGALVVTVDVAVSGRRERDLRNGFTVPPRVTARNLLEVLARPRWLAGMLAGPRATFANFSAAELGAGSGILNLARFIAATQDASIAWRDLAWLRSFWPGPLVVKGVLTAADAKLAVEHGAAAVIVSNHGGRQLDGVPSSIRALPEVVDAVAGRIEVLLDGGVRRGTDVAKALALGARAVLVGRPFLYGLGALGPGGALRALEILREELDNCMALLGAPSIGALDRSFVRMRRTT
jgi:L-lactate dehydrogenase (cytochrome)